MLRFRGNAENKFNSYCNAPVKGDFRKSPFGVSQSTTRVKRKRSRSDVGFTLFVVQGSRRPQKANKGLVPRFFMCLYFILTAMGLGELTYE